MRDREYKETLEFLPEFFKYTEQNVELRSLVNGGGSGRQLFTRNPDEVVAFCRAQDVPGKGVFMAMATRRIGSHRGRREDLCELSCVWVDIDIYKLGLAVADAVSALQKCPMPPSLIVSSGGGVHAYWLFREPLPVQPPADGKPDDVKEQVDAVLRQLAGVFAGDTVPAQIAAVMRLPGTYNTKTGELRPVTVLQASWVRYEFGDLVEMLDYLRPLLTAPAASSPAPQTTVDNPFAEFARRFATKAPIDVQQRLDAMSYTGAGETGVHQTQLQVSASLVLAGIDDDEIVALILDATHRAAFPHGERWNWKREEANLRRMIADWRKKHGSTTTSAGSALRPPATVVQMIRPRRQEAEPKEIPTEEEEAPQLAGFPLHDLGNALRLITQHRAVLRYVTGIGWHVWDGRRYALDPADCAARRLAHETARTMLLQAFEEPALSPLQKKRRERLVKFAVNSGNSAKTAAMLSQAEPHLCVVADDLDKDPMLLNCLNGTHEQKSCALYPHNQEDLLTKICGTVYDPDATCPIWEKFILDIFDGDAEVAAFVQRAFGYSITGLTGEQVVFILHGSGSNGKSVLLETAAAVLGDYAKQCPSETFISQEKGSRIPSDIARLAGARFVSVVETEHERNLAEGLVKQATGGDRMTARFLHNEWFEFTPKFKLWLATNHKPRIRGSDYAIWRRILLLPFNVTFVDADKLVDGQKVKDPDLKTKLVDEYPGILAWMVRGCAAWQKAGLRPPGAVVHATESYQDSQDNVSAFIRDNCHISRGLSCSIGLLYASYEIWCGENDEEAIPKRNFGKNLDARGYPPGPRSTSDRFRKGLDLTQECREVAAARLRPGDTTA